MPTYCLRVYSVAFNMSTTEEAQIEDIESEQDFDIAEENNPDNNEVKEEEEAKTFTPKRSVIIRIHNIQ